MEEKRFWVYFLGVGNALMNEPGIFHSNMIVGGPKKQEHNLFIDCGTDFPHSLRNAHMDYKDVKNLYISHLHGDHCGGLEWLGFITHFSENTEAPKLYVADSDIKKLEQMLKVSMGASADMKNFGMEAYFDVIPYYDKNPFEIGDITYTPIKTLHIDEGYGKMYSHALFIESPHGSALITTDTQFNSRLFMDYYRKADLIFHDCSTSPYKYSAHAHISELQKLPAWIKEKMILYHYSPDYNPLTAEGFKDYARQNIYYYFGK